LVREITDSDLASIADSLIDDCEHIDVDPQIIDKVTTFTILTAISQAYN
jgi:hypothetical protein